MPAVRNSRVAILVSLLVVGLAALLPAAAGADGDPASDVLLGENVFYPYTPPVSAATQKALNAVTAKARAANSPVKVALIASPVDLGVIPSLFNQPQKYADFLDQEISFQGKQPLLVVMPAGYGVQGLDARVKAAVAGLPKPAGKTSEDLAQAAITAVTKIAEAGGHALKGGSSTTGSSHSSGGSSATVIVVVLAAAALLVAVALIALSFRRRGAGAAR